MSKTIVKSSASPVSMSVTLVHLIFLSLARIVNLRTRQSQRNARRKRRRTVVAVRVRGRTLTSMICRSSKPK